MAPSGDKNPKRGRSTQRRERNEEESIDIDALQRITSDMQRLLQRARNRQANNSAVVNTLAGVVELQTDGTWTAMSSATAVNVGQHVRTAPGATALLALPDGSLVYLGSATEIWLDELATS